MTIEGDVHYHGVCESKTCEGAERRTGTINDGHDGRDNSGEPRCLECGGDLEQVVTHNPETPEDQTARGVGVEETAPAAEETPAGPEVFPDASDESGTGESSGGDTEPEE